ncbi:protoporphyrinogen/coproporphyrinogen oxidase [Nakamurella lactea]|uniref:protoporphyrinogen/coproporphyrinogen oxidase n=1 Tax=Nakamurella lactea TaxID=459515 RepID=UPI001B7FC0F0|nr:FAD-dependent oxidoreductase [Nakamurella lactea]
MTAFRLIVVGGGMAGLVAAHRLAMLGLRPLLLEASSALGGAVARHRVAGIELDAGAESFATARPAVSQLLAELGLGEDIVAPAPLGSWLRHAGGTDPAPRTALLGIPGRLGDPDVRRIIGGPGVLRARLDTVLPPRIAAPTLGALVRRRMGTRVLERLVEPVVGGVHSADPSLLEVDAVVPGLTAALGSAGSLAGAVRALRGGRTAPGAAVAGIRGGMAELPLALAAAIIGNGGEIRCGTAVSALEQTPTGWVLWGGGERLTADAVLLALPAAPTRALLAPVLGGSALPAAAEPATPVTLATLVIDDARLDAAPRGTGLLVSPRVTEIGAKALTHATAKWPWLAASLPPGRHVLRLSYGRGGFDSVISTSVPPDGALPSAALLDAGALLGIELREQDVRGSAVVHWPGSLPQAREGHTAAVARLRGAAASFPGLAVAGSALAGNGLAAVVADSEAQVTALVDRIRH